MMRAELLSQHQQLASPFFAYQNDGYQLVFFIDRKQVE